MEDDHYIPWHPAYEDEPILCSYCDGSGITESTFADEETNEIINEPGVYKDVPVSEDNTPCQRSQSL